MKQEDYDFDFANSNNKEQRIAQLNKLKQIQAELLGLKDQINSANVNNSGDEFNNGASKNNARQTNKTKTLSTNIGRAMSSYEQQGGFASALMLGILAFIFEVLFLTISLFIYR